MPRYHFHLRDGVSAPDSDGVELADLAAARAEASRLAGRLLLDHPEAFWAHNPWSLSVTDAEGRVLLTLELRGGVAPAGSAND